MRNNPYGSDWSETDARMLAGPMPSDRIAMLRHLAWLAWVDHQPANASPDNAAALQRLRGLLAQTCERSAAWSDSVLAIGRRPQPCGTLVNDGLHSQGQAPPR